MTRTPADRGPDPSATPGPGRTRTEQRRRRGVRSELFPIAVIAAIGACAASASPGRTVGENTQGEGLATAVAGQPQVFLAIALDRGLVFGPAPAPIDEIEAAIARRFAALLTARGVRIAENEDKGAIRIRISVQPRAGAERVGAFGLIPPRDDGAPAIVFAIGRLIAEIDPAEGESVHAEYHFERWTERNPLGLDPATGQTALQEMIDSALDGAVPFLVDALLRAITTTP